MTKTTYFSDGEGRLTYSDETNYKYNAQGNLKSKEKTHVSYVYRYENGQNVTDNTILRRKQWQYEGNRLISVVTKSYDANGTVQEYEKQSYSNGKLAEEYTKD